MFSSPGDVGEDGGAGGVVDIVEPKTPTHRDLDGNIWSPASSSTSGRPSYEQVQGRKHEGSAFQRPSGAFRRLYCGVTLMGLPLSFSFLDSTT